MDNFPIVDQHVMDLFQQTITHAVVTYFAESAPVMEDLHHMVVEAACTQGNLQCSKTGGSEKDNAKEIKEGQQSFYSAADIAGAVTVGVGLGFFIISDFLWAGFIVVSFIVLAVYSIIRSVQK